MKNLVLLASVVLLSACSAQPGPAENAATPAPAPVTIPITTKSPEALAHYKRGQTLFENARMAEGVEELAQALKLDPDFLSAKALHGAGTPGPNGLKEMEEAFDASERLPEAEKLVIEANVAQRRGELDTVASTLKRLTEVAPGDYLGFLLLGQEMLNEQKYAEAQQALKRATELNPSNGGAQNQLGYASLRQGDTAAAIAAFEQYARILPQEANAQDSLGEALLAAGRFADAEAAFQKALALSPKFWPAHQGIAYAKFYGGDWAGGRAALMKAKAIAPRVVDKLSVDMDLAAAAAAQRDFAQTQRVLAGMDKAPGAQPSDVALVPVLRGLAQVDAGRAREALASVAVAVAAADSEKFPPGLSRNLRRDALRVRVTAEAQLGDAAAAQKSSAALDADAANRAGDPQSQSAMHFGRGMAAMAKSDVKAALAEFDQCSREDQICAWQRVMAAEKSGDTAAAAAAREQALKIYGRDTASLVVRSRLGARSS